MSKIESLTLEQESMMSVYSKEWIGIGTAYNRPTRREAESSVADIYRLAGMPPPKFVVIADSPLSGALCVEVMNKLVNGGDSVWDSVWASVRASVGDSVRDSVWDSVWDSVGDSVWASVRDSVRDSVWDSVRPQNYVYLYAWAEFYRKELGINFPKELNKKLDLCIRAAKTVGWMFTYEGVCVVTKGPKKCHLLDGEIHNESGPAILYDDGFSVYAIEGVRVPEKVVMAPETISLDDIGSEENAEVKRVMRERYGTGRWLNDTGAKVVDVDTDFHGGMRALVEDSIGTRWMEGSDGSTGRVYFMRANGSNCREAHESLWNGMLNEDMRVGQS